MRSRGASLAGLVSPAVGSAAPIDAPAAGRLEHAPGRRQKLVGVRSVRPPFPLESRGVVRDRLAEVDRLEIGKQAIAEHRRKDALKQVALDLERLGCDLPFAAAEIFGDEVAERPKRRYPGARSSLLEGWIAALLCDRLHLEEPAPASATLQAGNDRCEFAVRLRFALASDSRLECLGAARFEDDGETAAEGKPRRARRRAERSKMGLPALVVVGQSRARLWSACGPETRCETQKPRMGVSHDELSRTIADRLEQASMRHVCALSREYQAVFVDFSRSLALATPAGLEPATCRLEGGCSIQLSYGAELNGPTGPHVTLQCDQGTIRFGAKLSE